MLWNAGISPPESTDRNQPIGISFALRDREPWILSWSAVDPDATTSTVRKRYTGERCTLNLLLPIQTRVANFFNV